MVADQDGLFAEENGKENFRWRGLADFVNNDNVKRCFEVLVVPSKLSSKRCGYPFDVHHLGVHRFQILKR